MPQIVIFAPVGGNLGIDHAGALVEDALRVAVGPLRGIDRFPDVPLLAGAGLVAQHQFQPLFLFHRVINMAEIVAVSRAIDLAERADLPEDILVFIDVDVGILTEINGIGAGREGAVEIIGVEHLHGQRFPAAGGTAIGEARPALAKAAELLFDLRHQLLHDGIAIGAEIGGIHRIAVVIIGIAVVDLDDEHPREAA